MACQKNLPKILIGILLVLTLAGCQGFKYTKPSADGIYHTVQEGQTLYNISKAYNISIEALKQANSIDDETKIAIGTRLWIPGARRVEEVASTIKGQKPSRLRWPVDGGIITSRFGYRNDRYHDGIDIGAKEGTPVVAAADGRVMYSGWAEGYGMMLVVKHAGHLTTIYAHNSKNKVKKNARVKKGQVIGEVGQTGKATGPHLHFEVRNDTHPKDPLHYLP